LIVWSFVVVVFVVVVVVVVVFCFPFSLTALVLVKFQPSNMRFANIPRPVFESYHDQINAFIGTDDDATRYDCS
jgi:hypothetical protein